MTVSNGDHYHQGGANYVSDVIGKDRAVYAAISAGPFPPKKWISDDPLDYAMNLVPKANGKRSIDRFISECPFAEFITRRRQDNIFHRPSASSISRKTSSPEMPFNFPASYWRMRSEISFSQAASAPGSASSMLERMRCASVRRWSLGRRRASDARRSTDFTRAL
jgi:hypothetical protein